MRSRRSWKLAGIAALSLLAGEARAQGQPVDADTDVDQDEDELELEHSGEEVFEVEAAPDRSSAAAQIVIRRNAAHAGDAVGAQEIARTPDRNAADASRRIVGASLLDGRYLVVRGLGERYTHSLLNGSPLPSPEPDRQAVPLDLFPALVISDITIAKTFTPDVPGDFAGGSIRLHTRELPSSFLFQATLTTALNTVSTFADRLTYRGSSLDWLGIDGGARAFPENFPDYKVVRLGPKPDGSAISREEIDHYGRRMNSSMSTQATTNLPSLSGSAVIGDSVSLGGGQRLGGTFAMQYGRRFVRRPDEILRTYAVDPSTPGGLTRLNDYRAETGIDQVSWSGLGTATYEAGPDSKVTLTGLHSRSAEIEARHIEGFNEERGADIRDTRLRFLTRSLTFGQVTGEHRLRSARDAVLGFDVSLSLATADEPDTRQTVYASDPSTGIFAFERGTLSGSHFFAEQREQSVGAGLDYTQPLSKGDLPVKLKAGGRMNLRARTFDARRFRFIPRPGIDPTVLRLAADRLFTRDNIGPVLELEEYTRPNDSYTAEHDVLAGYLMADAALTTRLRFIGGARVERSRQSIDSFDPFAPDETRVENEIDDVDLLPSVGLVYRVASSANLRASATKTVARPQLRELSPFVFSDYFGARDVLGNPELGRAEIYNGDLRFEMFPSGSEVLALSVFYKHFDAPIEQIIIPSGRGIVSYRNARAARTAGVELEMRKSLGLMAEPLRDLGVLANLTLARSRVELAPEEAGIQTNQARALAGQSPYVVNLGLDWSSEATGTRARILYNVFGPRIAQVGAGGLPDVYEQPRQQLDLTVAQRAGEHLDFKISAENLLDAPVLFTQGESDDADGGNVVSRYAIGTTVWLGATYSH